MDIVDEFVGHCPPWSLAPSARGHRVMPQLLGADRGADVAMVASMRRIGRVAAVAAEVGARFAREGIEMDPVDWLRAPRAAFGGRSAIEACQSRTDFLRGMLAHGLSLDLDPDRATLDALLAKGDRRVAPRPTDMIGAEAVLRRSAQRPRLFTATLTAVVDDATLFMFKASITLDRAAFEERLRRRVGWRLADRATVRPGYDAADPVCALLVSGPLGDELLRAEADPEGAGREGYDVQLEQRFPN
jgi:hypothetical protein